MVWFLNHQENPFQPNVGQMSIKFLNAFQCLTFCVGNDQKTSQVCSGMKAPRKAGDEHGRQHIYVKK
jgi:hypothetical protein